jgi:5-methylcytosine-specific restriction endonuclease McrA
MKSPVDDWTDARFKSFVTSAIRGAFGRFPNKYAALKNAAIGRKVNKKSGKLAMHYKCAGCKLEYTSTNVAVDHINPVVEPEVGFVSWDVYVSRMFVPTKELQVLCKECHDVKTAIERSKRCRTTTTSTKKKTTPKKKATPRKRGTTTRSQTLKK